MLVWFSFPLRKPTVLGSGNIHARGAAGHLLASLQKGRMLCVAAKKRLFAMSGLGNVSLQVIKTKIALVRIHISHHKRKKNLKRVQE